MRARAWVVAGIVLALPGLARALPICPGDAPLTVFARNLSADVAITLSVEGELVAEDWTCTGSGAATYAATVRCTGQGTVPCEQLPGLRPGAWIHRVAVTVSGSAQQLQAQRTVLMGAGASNVVVWTVYPRTFVVDEVSEAALRAQLGAAEAFTNAGGAAALVTFARGAFPGATDPRTITLAERRCDQPFNEHCSALRLEGSRLTIDALDARAEPGAVVLSVGDLRHSVVRVLGGGNVLRGLALQGTTTTSPCNSCQYDTIAISGTGARGTRVERAIVHGPTKGDAIGVDRGAGTLAAGGLDPVVIDGSEIDGARDKGLKVTTGSFARIQRSCVHDNDNGGVQSALGGRVDVVENVIQHNVPGPAQNGISVGGDADDEEGASGGRSALSSNGNIVRFAGSRGLSVSDNGEASFVNDYVSDAQFAGVRIETRQSETVPQARFRGVTFACNNNVGITGVCEPREDSDGVPCAADADCCGGALGCCPDEPGCTSPAYCKRNTSVDGVGAVVASVCPDCASPVTDFGSVDDPGRNALTQNPSELPFTAGFNMKLSLPGFGPELIVPARGNQWEHCGTLASCDQGAIATTDVWAVGGFIDSEAAIAQRAGNPAPMTYSPGRPAAGDVVRIFGRGFNAIDGAACFPGIEPAEPCSVENPNMRFRNNCPRTGNCVQIVRDGEVLAVDVAAVTPTMIAFRMPVDCYGPATLRVARQGPGPQNRLVEGSMPFCDPSGCADKPAGEPCDDGNPCSVDDRCTGTGATCAPGAPRVCAGACLSGTCDPASGCVPAPVATTCDDGDPCTAGDHCSGTGDVCVPGGNPCGQCTTRVCGPGGECTPIGAGEACDDGDPCTEDDYCDGAGGCLAGVEKLCDDADPCTNDVCDGTGTCRHPAFQSFEAITCRTIILAHGTAGTATGRKMGRVVAAVARASNGAASAKAAGNLRGALAQLRRARSQLRKALTVLRQGRGMPLQELRTLRDVVRAALAEVNAQRETIVEALAGVA